MELTIGGDKIEGPYNDIFRIIYWNMGFERLFNSPGQLQTRPLTIIKDIDEGSPEIMMGLFNF